MNLTSEQAAATVHSKKVEYSLDAYPEHKIILHQKFAGDLLGGCTWRGAALLARLLLFEPAMEYLELKHYMRQPKYSPVIPRNTNSNNSSSCPFSSCIELGSGAGLVALAAAASGKFSSKILATEDDEPEILELLEKNIRENFEMEAGSVRKILSKNNNNKSNLSFTSLALPWGQMKLSSSQLSQLSPTHGGTYFDLILCSEVLYDPELVEPLLATILALCGNSHNPFTGHYPTVILTNDTRAGDAASVFLKKASKYFSIERWSVDGKDKEMTKELMEEFCPDWLPLKSNEEGIFCLQRKAEVKDLRTQLAKFEKKN